MSPLLGLDGCVVVMDARRSEPAPGHCIDAEIVLAARGGLAWPAITGFTAAATHKLLNRARVA